MEKDETEVIELFHLLEKLNHFFHQSSHFESKHEVEKFAASIYPEIQKAYYDTVWSWLPENEREKIESTQNENG